MLSFKFADTFFSFFKSHPPMDEQATVLLNKNSATLTAMFLLGLRGWGSEFCHSNSDLSVFLSQIKVNCIMHNKMPRSPEHEFLIIETEDREGRKTPLILERTVGIQRETDETDHINDFFPRRPQQVIQKDKTNCVGCSCIWKPTRVDGGGDDTPDAYAYGQGHNVHNSICRSCFRINEAQDQGSKLHCAV